MIQPGAGKYEQLVSVAAALHFIAQHSHEGATLMSTHARNAGLIAGHALVIEQRASPPVHYFKRGDLRIRNAEFGTEVPPQARRDDALGVQQLFAQANEADM